MVDRLSSLCIVQPSFERACCWHTILTVYMLIIRRKSAIASLSVTSFTIPAFCAAFAQFLITSRDYLIASGAMLIHSYYVFALSGMIRAAMAIMAFEDLPNNGPTGDFCSNPTYMMGIRIEI